MIGNITEKLVPDEWVERYCELTNRDPNGEMTTFISDSVVHSTFREVARREIELVLAAAPAEIQNISAEFKAARNTLKFLNYTWTGGEHWRPPLGLPPESVTGIDYKKLVEDISRIVFGNLDHVEHLPIVIRATFGRYQSCP